MAAEQPTSASISMNQIVALEVQNLDEALLVLNGGLENLQSAQERGLIDRALTHKVVTICLTYENLLCGVVMTKSKLQARTTSIEPTCLLSVIVELAVGNQYTTVQEHDWDDRSKLKSLVTMENGVNALVTALAEVRAKDPAFVRYHGSKLTVLLQDTIKASAKFLSIVALPASIPSGEEDKVSTVIRSIQQFRSAVCVSTTVSPWGKPGASRDRSLEGFTSRFAQQQQSQGSSGENQSALSLLFSSSDIQERSRQALDAGGAGGMENARWEKELDSMGKRYGPDVDLFATSFFQPSQVAAPVASGPVSHTSESFAGVSSQIGLVGVRSSGEMDFDVDSDGDSLNGDPQHSLLSQGDARIHHHEYGTANSPPGPASLGSGGSMSRRAKSTPGRSQSAGTGTSSLRASTTRSAGGHSRTLPNKKVKLEKQLSSSQLSAKTTTATRPATSTSSARVAAKPSSRATMAATPILKIRRETASSTMKKSRLAAMTAGSPFARQQKKRTPFK